MQKHENLWRMHLTVVNEQTGEASAITYPGEKAKLLEMLDLCQIPYGSGAYSHLAASPNKSIKPDSLQLEMARMIEDPSCPPSVQELNHLGEQIRKMSQEERGAYEQELQKYPGLDIKTAINAAHQILSDGIIYDGESLAGRALLTEEQEPLLCVQLIPDDADWTDDPTAGVWLGCPAGERELTAAAQAMGVSSVDELTVNNIAWTVALSTTSLWEGPDYCTRCSDINRMASALKAQGGMAQAAKFKAALALEACYEFDKAADIAERLDQYEFYWANELCDLIHRTAPDANAGELAESLGFEDCFYGYVRRSGSLTLDEQLSRDGPDFQTFSM